MSTIDTSSALYQSLGLTGSSQSVNEETDTQADFMELLIAQLENQDPLEPMENGEFLAQLAQFETASGIEQLNTTASSLISSITSNQALQASLLVGRDVLVEGNTGGLGETGGMSGAADLKSSTSSLQVNIYDTAGQVVRTINLGQRAAGQVDFTWDGITNSGNRAAAGSYVISAEAEINDEMQSLKTYIAAPVDSVTLGQGGGEATLSVSGVGEVPMSKIRQIM